MYETYETGVLSRSLTLFPGKRYKLFIILQGLVRMGLQEYYWKLQDSIFLKVVATLKKREDLIKFRRLIMI